MICRYCRERIEDDAPVIETAEGANVCEPCQENQYRVEESQAVRDARVLRGTCPDCGAKVRFGGELSCGGHCMTCRGLYSRTKPSYCTGPHDLLRDLQALLVCQ